MTVKLIAITVTGLVAMGLADSQPQMQYDPKTISTCTWWYDNYRGDTCQAIRDWTYAISPEDFTRWNPSVGLDCSNWQQLSYCVQAPGQSTSTSSSSVSSTIASSTTRSPTASPSPVLSGWNDLGCYVDANTLSNKTDKAGGASLTVDKCEAACFGGGYMYAGVETGTDCWCGHFVAASWTANQTDCNIPCGGNKTQTCGGKSVLNVFEAKTKDALPPAGTPSAWPSLSVSTTSKPISTATATSTKSSSSVSPAKSTWQAVGCYRDTYPNSKRTLQTLTNTSDTSQTPTNCQGYCLKAGTTYAGLENGRECWCGNEIQVPANNTPVAETDCNKPCTGDKTLLCGQGARIYLYKYIVPTVPWIGLGCYAEETVRVLKNKITVLGGATNNTRQNCISTLR